MTAVKTRVGLLYMQQDAEICKRLAAELTSRCPDVELSADIVVHNDIGLSLLLLFSMSMQIRYTQTLKCWCLFD